MYSLSMSMVVEVRCGESEICVEPQVKQKPAETRGNKMEKWIGA